MRSLGRPAFFLCLATGSLPVFDAALAQTRTPAAVLVRAPSPAADPAPSAVPRGRPGTLISTLTFADLGFRDGFRFANLGGRREIFVHLPLFARQ